MRLTLDSPFFKFKFTPQSWNLVPTYYYYTYQFPFLFCCHCLLPLSLFSSAMFVSCGGHRKNGANSRAMPISYHAACGSSELFLVPIP